MSDSGTDAAMDEDGNRIIRIQLPSGKTVGATVDPSLKMMDLVISIATKNKLSPTSYQIAQPSKHRGRPPVIYTPSQSVADIEGSNIMLLPKKEKEQYSINKGSVKKSGIFEHTVRLTIYSAKNHKMTFRTNPEKTLEEVFEPICKERGVDPSRYMMRVHKQKADPDMAQPISSFGTLEFDLLEKAFLDNDNKRKSILFGRLKKKDDEDELQKNEKPVATVPAAVNGPQVKTAPAPERNLQKQTSAEGGAKTNLQKQNSAEGVLKKRPAPPPPTSASVQPGASPPPTAAQPPVSTSTLNRSATKKRRAPPVPTAAIPVSAGHGEADGTQLDRSSEGNPPSSPAISQHSSLGASSDRDISTSGSVGERDSLDVDEADGRSTPRDNFRQSSDDEGCSIRSSSTGTSRSEDNREAFRADIEAPVQGSPPVIESPPPPYVELMPPPPMPHPPLISDNVAGGEGLGGSAGAEAPRPKRVCKCYDPENGEDCDCSKPGAILKPAFGGASRSTEPGGEGVDDFPPPPLPEDVPPPPDYLPPPPPPDVNQPDVIPLGIGPSAEDGDQLKMAEMTAGMKRADMGERSLETTNYSPPPQEEDLGTMEEKSVKFGRAVSVDAGESVSTQAVSADRVDEVKTELSAGGQAGKVGVEEISSDKQGVNGEATPTDLKDMYMQMQKQLAELQQTMLAQQQSTNQTTAAQAPAAASQVQPPGRTANQMSSPGQLSPSVDQTALLQLQQLQQQMMLQQQLLMQQGLLPRTPMMMPPVMMQPTPPMIPPTPGMMVQMTPQMTPQGVMMQPYVVSPQPQMVMVSPQSQMAQSTTSRETSETVQASSGSSHDSAQKTPEDTGKTDLALTRETSGAEHAANWIRPSATEQVSVSGDADRTQEKASDKPLVENEVRQRTDSASSGVQTGSPSSRRKDVFADILKKKGKPKTNYVLSAQREMNNRRNSAAKPEVTLSDSGGKEHVGTALSTHGRADSLEHPRASYEGTRNSGTGLANQSTQSGERSDDQHQHSETVTPSTITKEVETSIQSAKPSPALGNAPSVGMSHSTTAVDEKPPPSKSDSASSVATSSSPQVVTGQSPPQSGVTSPSHGEEGKTPGSELNVTNNNNVIVRENGDLRGEVKVTQFEASFAGETSRDKVTKEVTSKENEPAANFTAGKGAKPPPPTVPPRPRQGPRPFNKTRRPVSLASDSQGELQQLTSLSNVSRFKEMMEGLQGKEN